MKSALQDMLAKYPRKSTDEQVNALREVFQELALLGLWRGKFFEHAAFYGGTALRILYGLDRFSEDMDFSLLTPDDSFRLQRYLPHVEKELSAWGFSVKIEVKEKSTQSAIESAFLKANTKEQLLTIEAGEKIITGITANQTLKIKIEVDTDPPSDFDTETKFCLQPIPFSVRAYTQPCLFAGKMHALLCRGWKNNVKGRDWYDFIWYVKRNTNLNLRHLETRMRQSGHYAEKEVLTEERFQKFLTEKIASLNVDKAKADVVRFLPDTSSADIWSRDFLMAVAEKVIVETPDPPA